MTETTNGNERRFNPWKQISVFIQVACVVGLLLVAWLQTKADDRYVQKEQYAQETGMREGQRKTDQERIEAQLKEIRQDIKILLAR